MSPMRYNPTVAALLARGGIRSWRAAYTVGRQQPLASHHLPTCGIRHASSKAEPNGTRSQAQLLSAIAVSTSAILGTLLYLHQQRSVRLDSASAALVTKTSSNVSSQSPQLVEGRHSRMHRRDMLDVQMEPLDDMSKLPKERAILTTAPNVPPPITRDYPVLLQVALTTTTKLVQLTNQYKYEKWTFNDSVPGPFIRARVGDVVELSLSNDDMSGNPHNIDCHAFTGPGGGAQVTTVEQHQTKTARFKLLSPGIYLYHCAAAPVPVHIANGMYGLMYVQPEHDLPPVDHEYYVVQSEFYHEPPEVLEDGRPSTTVEFSYPNCLREEPNIVVFNGSEAALTRDKPLTARVGESVRIFFGNAGPNLSSSFHVIGSVFNNVYRDGDVVSPPGRFISTVGVSPGAATIVDMKMQVPGTYALVDHAISRLDKGAVGFLNVSGEQNPDILRSAQPPQSCVGCKLHA